MPYGAVKTTSVTASVCNLRELRRRARCASILLGASDLLGLAACVILPCVRVLLGVGSGPFRFSQARSRVESATFAVPGCRVLHDAGMMVLARLGVCLVVVLAAVRAFGLCASEPFRSSQPACARLCAVSAVPGCLISVMPRSCDASR